ncbi:MAG: hypothetical protein IH840_10570 [Candidatus Heimdallarchaeota archaeon]|nr:hypothetical protein [Candidatus Heimdallarchaeota archaeon]
MTKFIKSLLTFFTLTTVVIGLTLIPYGTTFTQMLSDLLDHPIYTEPIVDQAITIDARIWFFPWFVFFTSLQAFSLVIFLLNPEESTLIDVITLQLTLMSIFFISTHAQFTLWLLPWLIFWGIKHGGKSITSPIFILLGYLGIRFGVDYSVKFVQTLGAIILLTIGLLIIRQTVRYLWASRVIDIEAPS